MFRTCKLSFLAVVALALILLPLCVGAQQQQKSKPAYNATAPLPAPTPPPQNPEEAIQIYTEEVRLPVFAYDEYGNFDHAVEADDLLVLEDGVPQIVRSVRHVPANVLLLLDTGGESVGLGGLYKSTYQTREVALRVLAGLHDGDRIEVMQFADHPEMLQEWTTDKQSVARALNRKLHSGRRVRLAEAITAASQSFKDTPEGSRHVVLVTDGVETPGSAKTNRAEALKQLIATRATIHVISYTEFVRQKKSDKTTDMLSNAAIQRQSSIRIIANAGIDPSRPSGQNNGNGGNSGINFDPAMRRLRKAYEADARQSEQWLTNLAEETGGRIWLSKSAQEMIDEGAKVARDIGAQYVVTYTPKRPFVSARAGEYRRLEVAPRRIGLTLRARRGYITTPSVATPQPIKPQ